MLNKTLKASIKKASMTESFASFGMPLAIMKIEILGIIYNSQRDAGTCLRYGFGLVVGKERQAITTLLSALSVGSEVGLPDPTNGDCMLEVRRTKTGFEAKRDCHGVSGTWQPVAEQEALAWLMPGVFHISKTARPGYGGMLTHYHSNG